MRHWIKHYHITFTDFLFGIIGLFFMCFTVQNYMLGIFGAAFLIYDIVQIVKHILEVRKLDKSDESGDAYSRKYGGPLKSEAPISVFDYDQLLIEYPQQPVDTKLSVLDIIGAVLFSGFTLIVDGLAVFFLYASEVLDKVKFLEQNPVYKYVVYAAAFLAVAYVGISLSTMSLNKRKCEIRLLKGLETGDTLRTVADVIDVRKYVSTHTDDDGTRHTTVTYYNKFIGYNPVCESNYCFKSSSNSRLFDIGDKADIYINKYDCDHYYINDKKHKLRVPETKFDDDFDVIDDSVVIEKAVNTANTVQQNNNNIDMYL
jgi:hypothetical protein